VRLEEEPEAEFTMHSEEHLVMKVYQRERYLIGQTLHGIPRHVCPSVSMYGEAIIVSEGKVIDTWPVTARNRRLVMEAV
jgi:D-serine deaminase-like pyridoxal phosphate-dependent protein